jgi:metallophosphoesterase superfamily enzyme
MASPGPPQRRLHRLVATLRPCRAAGTAAPAASSTPHKILVIADVHGNAAALRAVLEREADAASTVFLGDSVLSGPQVRETMALLQSLHAGKGGVWIAGNHDEEMLHPVRHCIAHL